MNSLAVMQPYLFPYIGYFQLIHAVDMFIFYDDVDFIKNGWINRNKILINGDAKYITIPCSKVSSFRKINSVKHNLDRRKRKKLLKKIRFSYANAPFFNSVYPIIKSAINYDSDRISDVAIKSLLDTCEYLSLDTIFKKSSECFDNHNLDAADRLIDITKQVGADHYINAFGGKELYNKKYFKKRDLKLSFLKPEKVHYDQFGDKFVPCLSIIDVMMFNEPDLIKRIFLKSYQLV